MCPCTSPSISQTRQRNGCVVLVTDRQRSVLRTATENSSHTYTAYGYCRSESELASLLAYTGSHIDPVTKYYPLGNGNRTYSPVLMRFLNADPLSPFSRGGLNTYTYCLGDPVNRVDPSGHASIRSFFNWLRGKPNKPNTTRPLPDLKSEDYQAEVAQTKDYLEKRTPDGEKMLTITTGSTALEAATQTEWHHKFIYTIDKELVVASYDPTMIWPTHASIAAVSTESNHTSNRVLAAGYIWISGGLIKISDWSGHYRPQKNKFSS